MAIKDILGKVVTVTANEEVGYGTEGNSVLGVVTAIEETRNTELGFDGLREAGTFKVADATVTALGGDPLTKKYVATVAWGRTFTNIPISATALKKPAIGGFCIVDGLGNLAKIVDATAEIAGSVCKVLSVDTVGNVASVKIV